jgi:hypothetical protein
MFKSQFVNVTQKNGHQGHDYKGGLLYQRTINFNQNFKKIGIFHERTKDYKNKLFEISPSSSKWVYVK